MSEEPRPNWSIWLERVFLVGILAFAAYRFGPQLGAWVGVGPGLGEAPAYELTTLDGEVLGSTELRGRVVVLNFWATWCLPCRAEMPSLQALHEDLAEEGVAVLGLATDVGREAPIRDFLAERDITYPVGRATNEQRRAFGSIRGIPTTFLIDRDGVIRHRVVGYFAPPVLRTAVRRLLREEAEQPTPLSAGTTSAR